MPVPLSSLTTLGLGGPATELVTAESDEQVIQTLRRWDAAADPADPGRAEVLLLAGGSNLVIADAGVPYPVLRIATTGITAATDGDDLLVSVAAGQPWDSVVEQFTAEGWSGIEFLSGIPGSTGATPIQNVGAYGAEVSDTLVDVTGYDRRTGAVTVLSAAELGLGYRDSVLRHHASWVVLSVRFRLRRDHGPIRYGELAAAVGVAPGHTAPPAQVRAAVLALRRAKGMVLDPADPDTRSVGSFFTNPLLDDTALDAAHLAITARFGVDARYPRYPTGSATKLSAAWLIDRAGFAKGFALPGGGAAISSKHTLALTNRGGTTADLIALAGYVRDGVLDAFGVELKPEPILVGVTL